MRSWPVLLLLLACQSGGAVQVRPGPTATPTDSGSATGSTPTATTPWDPSPAVAPRGAIAWFRITCGLLQGNPVRGFRKVDDVEQRWEMIPPEASDVQPGVVACTIPGEDLLLWHPDGFIEVWASDLYHAMDPTPVADRWLGTTWPESGSSPECDEALADLGLAWPVTLTMELVEIEPPTTP